MVVIHLGLGTTFEIFGTIVAGVALTMAVLARRLRPAGQAPRPARIV